MLRVYTCPPTSSLRPILADALMPPSSIDALPSDVFIVRKLFSSVTANPCDPNPCTCTGTLPILNSCACSAPGAIPRANAAAVHKPFDLMLVPPNSARSAVRGDVKARTVPKRGHSRSVTQHAENRGD